MEKKATLALCIPAYNAAHYLPTLLTSAAKQVIPFDEILVYNDCSTDNTSEVAKKYGAIVVEGDINRGCSAGKNRLAVQTKCDFIHFHDADDNLLPNFTSLAHQWMSKKSVPDVVLFAYEYRDFDTNELLSTRYFDANSLEKNPIRYTILEQVNPFCGLYKKEKLLEVGCYDIDESILYNEDVAFHCKLAQNGFTFSAEPTVSIINYRISTSMSSANQAKCAKAHYEVMKKNAKNTNNSYGKEIAYKLWVNAATATTCQDYETAKNCVQLAVQLAGRIPTHESKLFQLMCMLSPYQATIWREKLIRIFKPHLRKN